MIPAAPTDTFRRTFRTIWRHLIPGNFHGGDGELVQYTEGLVADAFAETCKQTANLMFPSVAPSDALERIGADRGIPRGFSEPEASYRERLRAWRFPRGHRIRGNAVGLLEQIAAVFGGAVEAQTIDARGTRYTWGEDGTSTVERGVTWDWDGEALLPNWARFWIVIRPTGAAPWPSFDDGAWGDITDAPEYVCLAGSGIHTGQVAAIKHLVNVGRLSWTPAGRRPVYLVVWFEGQAYPAPTGDWDSWGARPVDTYAFEPLHAAFT